MHHFMCRSGRFLCLWKWCAMCRERLVRSVRRPLALPPTGCDAACRRGTGMSRVFHAVRQTPDRAVTSFQWDFDRDLVRYESRDLRSFVSSKYEILADQNGQRSSLVQSNAFVTAATATAIGGLTRPRTDQRTAAPAPASHWTATSVPALTSATRRWYASTRSALCLRW